MSELTGELKTRFKAARKREREQEEGGGEEEIEVEPEASNVEERGGSGGRKKRPITHWYTADEEEGEEEGNEQTGSTSGRDFETDSFGSSSPATTPANYRLDRRTRTDSPATSPPPSPFATSSASWKGKGKAVDREDWGVGGGGGGYGREERDLSMGLAGEGEEERGGEGSDMEVSSGEEFTGVPPPQVEEDEANINIDRTGPGEKDRQMLNIARLLQARRGDIAAIVDHEIKRLDLIDMLVLVCVGFDPKLGRKYRVGKISKFCESEEPYYLDAKRIKTNIFVNDGISDYALPISAVSNNPINMKDVKDYLRLGKLKREVEKSVELLGKARGYQATERDLDLLAEETNPERVDIKKLVQLVVEVEAATPGDDQAKKAQLLKKKREIERMRVMREWKTQGARAWSGSNLGSGQTWAPVTRKG